MQRVRDGKISDEYLDQLEETATRYPKPWTVGIGSHALAALIKELRELREETGYENDSPCLVCLEPGCRGGCID